MTTDCGYLYTTYAQKHMRIMHQKFRDSDYMNYEYMLHVKTQVQVLESRITINR